MMMVMIGTFSAVPVFHTADFKSKYLKNWLAPKDSSKATT